MHPQPTLSSQCNQKASLLYIEGQAKATKDSPYYTMTQSALDAIEGRECKAHIREFAKVVIHAIDNPKPKLRRL